jgi:hypothetical protein
MQKSMIRGLRKRREVGDDETRRKRRDVPTN